MKVPITSEFSLLVGFKSAMDEIIKEIKIDEYTGKYERRVVKKEFLDNPARGVTELISAITLQFGMYKEMRREQANKLKVCDRNLIMLHLRLLDSEMYDYEFNCPKCEKKSKRVANLSEIPIIKVTESERIVELNKPFKLTDKDVEKEYTKVLITMPNGSCQIDFFEGLKQQNPVSIKFAMIKHCVLSLISDDEKEQIPMNAKAFYDNTTVATHSKIIEDINSLTEGQGPQLRVSNTCDYCGEEDLQEIPIALFF